MSNNITQITGDIKGEFIIDVNNAVPQVTKSPDGLQQAETDTPSTTCTRKWIKLNGFPMWMFVTIGVLSFISFGYSLFTILVGYPVQIDLDRLTYDAASTTVTILSILVTFLAAWQIYATIKTKEELKEIHREIKADYNSKIGSLIERLSSVERTQVTNAAKITAVESYTIMERLKLMSKKGRENQAKERAKVNTPLYNWLWEVLKHEPNDETVINLYNNTFSISPKTVRYFDDNHCTKETLHALIEEIRLKLQFEP